MAPEAGETDNDIPCNDVAHLVHLAGAEALLDPAIAHRLQALVGVWVPVTSDSEFSHTFEYMVFDVDQRFSVNYCELVVANRLTARLLGTSGAR